jgi:hypothetical protein
MAIGVVSCFEIEYSNKMSYYLLLLICMYIHMYVYITRYVTYRLSQGIFVWVLNLIDLLVISNLTIIFITF